MFFFKRCNDYKADRSTGYVNDCKEKLVQFDESTKYRYISFNVFNVGFNLICIQSLCGFREL